MTGRGPILHGPLVSRTLPAPLDPSSPWDIPDPLRRLGRGSVSTGLKEGDLRGRWGEGGEGGPVGEFARGGREERRREGWS